MFWNRMKNLLGARKLSVAERKALKWKKDSMKCIQLLNKTTKAIKAEHIRFDISWCNAQSELTKAKESMDQNLHDVDIEIQKVSKLIERHDEVEESLTNELKILREIVIPELALANESIRSQMEADISLQAQRQAAYAPPKLGEE